MKIVLRYEGTLETQEALDSYIQGQLKPNQTYEVLIYGFKYISGIAQTIIQLKVTEVQ